MAKKKATPAAPQPVSDGKSNYLATYRDGSTQTIRAASLDEAFGLARSRYLVSVQPAN